jgi:CRP/FNR family transcriptional regulator, cyclic AMP receptor protein
MPLDISDKDRSAVVKMLSRVPLFASLGGKQIRTIASSFSRERSYKSGDVIEREGDSGIAFYLITEGGVEIRGGSKVLSKLSRGQFFGEMALIDRQPRSASVVAAAGGTKCLIMPSWSFRAALENDPKLAIGILRELSSRLRDATNALG